MGPRPDGMQTIDGARCYLLALTAALPDGTPGQIGALWSLKMAARQDIDGPPRANAGATLIAIITIISATIVNNIIMRLIIDSSFTEPTPR